MSNERRDWLQDEVNDLTIKLASAKAEIEELKDDIKELTGSYHKDFDEIAELKDMLECCRENFRYEVANKKALIAATYQTAEDVCEKWTNAYPRGARAMQQEIRALTPADATKKLREICLEVAKLARQTTPGWEPYGRDGITIEAVVNSVLNK